MHARVTLAALAALTGAAAAQGPAPLPPVTGKTGGETPAPGANGANDAINTPPQAPPPSGQAPAAAATASPGAISQDQAMQKLTQAGLQNPEGIYQDVTGAWRALARRNGAPVMAWVSASGQVSEAPLQK